MAFQDLKRFILGEALSNSQAEHERLPKWKALPVFSSDAMSSVAYATEEILIILAALSAAAAVWSLPIALTIAALLLIVSLSYRQTISLYPHGGGAYTVARENLGETPGLLAGAALMIDYILTVAVSISAGVAAITSALPECAPYAVAIALGLILIMTLLNLRGASESGLIFSIPTYFFIASILILLIVGFYRTWLGDLPPKAGIVHEAYPKIGLFLVLRAFASGCAALTGIEAISNGVPAFREPSAKNAKTTLMIMIAVLGTFFMGVTALAHQHLILPSAAGGGHGGGETVLSQLARTVFGDSMAYYAIQTATALILVMAANTAFADFPRLASILGKDRYMPRQLSNIGDRLVFSNGITVLGIAAALLIYLFDADTHALIPLYSVGVFLSFTLSQSGMVAHHLRHREPHWVKGLLLNLAGAIATALVLCVVAVTKFTEGAYIIILVIPAMLLLFRGVKRHYESVGRQLALPKTWTLDHVTPSIVVVPISGFHTGVLKALEYARGISKNIHVCVVDVDERATANVRQQWRQNLGEESASPLKLVVLDAPYRSVIDPVVDYLNELERGNPGQTLTVVIPEFVTKHWWHATLHNQTAFFLKTRLRYIERRVVVSVSYHLRE